MGQMAGLVRKYGEIIGLEEKDVKAFEDLALLVETDPAYWKALQDYSEGRRLPKEFLEDLKAFADERGYDDTLLYGTVILYLYDRMHDRYVEKGIPEEIFVRTAMDLKWKVNESYTVYGKPGCFVAWWYQKLFDLQVFGIGRLEFETAFYKGEDATVGGVTVREGDPVIGVHIPTTDEPFTRETCLDAYKKAYAFFGGKNGEKMIFHCSSWLLFPGIRDMVGPDSRIVDFQNTFKILQVKDSKGGGTAWRVYGKDFQKPVGELPEETSLQRGYKKRLMAGLPWGTAVGIFAFDGEKIWNDAEE